MLTVGYGEIALIDQRFYRLDEKLQILIALPASETRMLERRILGESLAPHVRNTDHDCIESIETHLGHGDVNIPRSRKTRCRIEQILSVVHVDHGKAALTGRISAR